MTRSLDFILSQINPVHILIFYFSTARSDISVLSMLTVALVASYLQVSRLNIFMHFSSPPYVLSHLILLTLDEQCNL
jgi:hypothetical protein